MALVSDERGKAVEPLARSCHRNPPGSVEIDDFSCLSTTLSQRLGTLLSFENLSTHSASPLQKLRCATISSEETPQVQSSTPDIYPVSTPNVSATTIHQNTTSYFQFPTGPSLLRMSQWPLDDGSASVCSSMYSVSYGPFNKWQSQQNLINVGILTPPDKRYAGAEIPCVSSPGEVDGVSMYREWAVGNTLFEGEFLSKNILRGQSKHHHGIKKATTLTTTSSEYDSRSQGTPKVQIGEGNAHKYPQSRFLPNLRACISAPITLNDTAYAHKPSRKSLDEILREANQAKSLDNHSGQPLMKTGPEPNKGKKPRTHPYEFLTSILLQSREQRGSVTSRTNTSTDQIGKVSKFSSPRMSETLPSEASLPSFLSLERPRAKSQRVISFPPLKPRKTTNDWRSPLPDIGSPDSITESQTLYGLGLDMTRSCSSWSSQKEDTQFIVDQKNQLRHLDILHSPRPSEVTSDCDPSKKRVCTFDVHPKGELEHPSSKWSILSTPSVRKSASVAEDERE